MSDLFNPNFVLYTYLCCESLCSTMEAAGEYEPGAALCFMIVGDLNLSFAWGTENCYVVDIVDETLPFPILSIYW